MTTLDSRQDVIRKYSLVKGQSYYIAQSDWGKPVLGRIISLGPKNITVLFVRSTTLQKITYDNYRKRVGITSYV